ncbi:MAG TPA: PAS domain S-box protein [Leptolyngbyaceae cyanobacterium M33_DOE_097]|nr:PAS domain S-box protein [Leptolyngbyaceae cyanobacterium M33_DOE_097]
MVSAWYGGVQPAIVATILSTLTINYFLLDPIHIFSIPDLGTFVRLSVFVMAALLTSSLNEAQRIARRKAEASLKSLRESEARFGCLAESNIIGMLVADLDGGILEANANFLQTVGYTQKELQAGDLHWRKMTPSESLESSERAIQELRATGVCTPFEKEYFRKDGSRVPVLHGAVMIGTATMTGFVLDLSERKQVEAIQQEALRRERSLHAEVQAANAQLETVLASLQDQFFVLDPDWRYLYVSDRVVDMVGRSREEILGQSIWELFPDTVGSSFYHEVRRAVAEQQIVHFEYFYPAWQRWFENRVYPSRAGVSLLVTDITERKQAEEKLQRTNQTLQTLVDVCPVAIAFFDPNGIIRLWNRAAERIYGWSASETIGQFMPTVSHWPQEFLTSVQTVLSGRSLAGFETQHQRKDGQMVNLEIWANLAHDADGNPGCLGIALDITERKQTEAALRESEARYQVLVSNMPGMAYRYAPAKNGRAVFTYVSTGSRELVELEPETILQDPNAFLRLVHPDDLPSFQESVAISVANSDLWQWEGRLITPSGQLKWVQGRSRPQHTKYGEAWDGLFFDITDRKQTEEALRQSEERLRVALKNSPITVFNQDQNLRHTWLYNPTINLEPAEILGKQDRDFLSEEDAAVLTQLKRRVLETGLGAREEIKVTMPEQVFYYDLTVEPLFNGNEETIGITCASIDITERKQMELALRRSETTLTALIASSPIAIALCDRDLRYLHANEALANVNGIPLSEHIGRTFEEVLPAWAPVLTPILQQVMATQEPVLNQEIVGVTHPSDVVRHALVNFFPVCLPSGEVLGVGVTSVDISDLKRIEDERERVQHELQQTLQTLRTLIQASPLPILVIAPDLTVNLWNSAAERLFDWSEAEVLGRPLPIIPEEKQEECEQLRDAVMNGEVFFAVETYRCRRDGSHVILSVSAAPLYNDHGNVNAILFILQDITERQLAEINLRDSEERLRLALMAANQGLYDLNIQTGDIIVTPAYAQMLGYDPDEFQETIKSWRDRFHPDDISVAHQAYLDYLAGKTDIYQVEFRQRTRSGDWKWILSIGRIVAFDEAGQPLRMLGTHTDITDRKQAETEREQLLAREKMAREAAETANRIKDEFLAVLSHELRSPLNPILGWSKLLQTRKLDAEKTQQALTTIERNAKLQTQLIEDLLDVSRILRGKLALNIAPVTLSSTIEAALETVRLAIEAKEINLRFEASQKGGESNSGKGHPPASSLQVMGDAARLQQVVWNLLTEILHQFQQGVAKEGKI